MLSGMNEVFLSVLSEFLCSFLIRDCVIQSVFLQRLLCAKHFHVVSFDAYSNPVSNF